MTGYYVSLFLLLTYGCTECTFKMPEGGLHVLNHTAMDCCELWQAIKTLQDVLLVNMSLTFFGKNVWTVYLVSILLLFIGGIMIFLLYRMRLIKREERELKRYASLSKRLHLIYEKTSMDMALYNKKGLLLKTYGYQKKRQASLFYSDLFLNPYLTDEQRKNITDNKPVNLEFTVDTGSPTDKTFERKACRLLIKPLLHKNLQDAAYAAIIIDTGEIVNERLEKESFESLVKFTSDSSRIGIAYYDVDTHEGIATESWFHNLREPLVKGALPSGQNVLPEDRLLLQQFRNRVVAGELPAPFVKEIRVLDGFGHESWVLQHLYVRSEDPRVVIELNLNIDKRKKYEIALHHAKTEAEQSAREAQKFLNNITHEIRTPLNSILGFAMLLTICENEEERNAYSAIVMNNNKLLGRLIEDIVKLSRLDRLSEKFEHEMIDMEMFFEEMKAAGYRKIYDKQLDLIVDADPESPTVYTDLKALQNILTNLYSNAVKFTQKGNITIGYRKHNKCYYFYVKDTGKGISPKDQERIFKRFVKVDAYVQGTGLGLTLCKTQVERLGGEIGVVSEPGKGSTFWFTIPYGESGICK